MTKTKLTKIDIDWKHVKNACRTTVNKKESNKEATTKFKTDLLISEHSPIRRINISWLWEDIKSWVATHYSRHKNECYISTQRTDRTGIDRDKLPQGQLVRMENDANAQQLIDIARKRLCYCASKETRKQFEDLKQTLHDNEETRELADILVPNCIYRLGCPEGFSHCKFFDKFLDNYNEAISYEEELNLLDIKSRYDFYNKGFYKVVDKLNA